jgi:hypothetical protein
MRAGHCKFHITSAAVSPPLLFEQSIGPCKNKQKRCNTRKSFVIYIYSMRSSETQIGLTEHKAVVINTAIQIQSKLKFKVLIIIIIIVVIIIM